VDFGNVRMSMRGSDSLDYRYLEEDNDDNIKLYYKSNLQISMSNTVKSDTFNITFFQVPYTRP
jgi:hypothetical protein